MAGPSNDRPGRPVRAAQAVVTPAELRVHRVGLGLTQAGLADLLGVTANTVARWERGEQRIGQALRLARVLARQEQRWARGRPPRPAPRPDSPSPSTRRSNLPGEVSRLIGREQECRTLLDLLGRTRLLTLVGTGGVGKTRLGLHVAAAALANFPDGVWFIALTALTDPQLVPQAVAMRLGVRDEPGRALVDSLADALGDRCLLLVLDNCEHLVRACAELAHDLLGACRRLSILTTSRQPLGVEGETTWRVPSLSVPTADAVLDPAALTHVDSAQLLLERITASVPGFALDATSAPYVAAICQRLDGIPLALELAAARVPSLGIAEVAWRLGDRFRLFMAAGQGRPARQQTLHATLDWSYSLLDPAERRLLDQLAVFVGGWTLEAAEAVCGGGGDPVEPVAELLARLVDKSLVQVEPQPAGASRFRFLEIVRQYAAEHLQGSAEHEHTSWRHARFFQRLASTVCTETLRPDMQSWLDRAEQEHDNFRAALGWLIVHHETDAAQQLAADLKRFWNFRGHLSEGRVWLRRALDLPGPATLARARAFDAAGNLAREQSDFTAMRPLMEAALATAEAVGDLSAREYAAAGLADLARFQGDLAAARAWFEQAAGLARRAGDQTMFGLDLHNLGRVAHDTGDYAAARALNEQALRIFEDTGYVLGTAFARNVLGWLSYLEGNSATGGALLERALRTCREIGERRGIGENLYHLAHVALERRDLPLARARLRECLLIEQALGQPRMIAFAVEGCARLATTLRRHELALCLAGAAATLRTAVGAPLSPSECRWLERWLAPARSALSPASRAVVWAAGQALSAEEACAEALALTVPASRPGTASPAGLTAREVEVLRLLAGGRSNKEIAACLVLGVRTVERHVANVYAKIGARGRTEATSFALRTGVVPAEVG